MSFKTFEMPEFMQTVPRYAFQKHFLLVQSKMTKLTKTIKTQPKR